MIAVCVGVFLHNLYAQNPNSKALDLKNTYVIEKTDSKAEVVRKAVHLIPNDRQYQALKDEFIAFIHFGPNTFTEMYWGRGKEDPAIFDLKELGTDQWYTAKHHDGFVLWQNRYTKHGIMSTGFQQEHGIPDRRF